MAKPNSPLQEYVDRYECKYFADNDTRYGETLAVAVRSPFIRLYGLNRDPKIVEALRAKYFDNERVQIFNRTHPRSWPSVLSLMPSDQPSILWLQDTEPVSRSLADAAFIRPSRRDIILFEPGEQRTALRTATELYGHTHSITAFSATIWIMAPIPRRRRHERKR